MKQKGFAPILIILSIVLLLGVAGGAYYLGTIKNNKPETAPVVTTNQNSPQPTEADASPVPNGTGETANWKTYTNTKYNFSIKYPMKTNESSGNWQYEEIGNDTNFGVGFGTVSSKSGGYIWGIWVVENGNIENLIKQIGSQFTDRKEKRENIKINGISALLVTVTTEQIKEFKWIFKNVYIQKGNKVYSIGNGAHDSPEFELFYNTFKFLSPNHLIPADADSPASGVCPGPQSATVAVITLNEDVPSSRCLKVSANQQLQVINSTNQTVTFTLGQNNLTIGPKQNKTITQIFGSYLAPGVHSTKTSLYGGNGPEIWLQ